MHALWMWPGEFSTLWVRRLTSSQLVASTSGDLAKEEEFGNRAMFALGTPSVGNNEVEVHILLAVGGILDQREERVRRRTGILQECHDPGPARRSRHFHPGSDLGGHSKYSNLREMQCQVCTRQPARRSSHHVSGALQAWQRQDQNQASAQRVASRSNEVWR